MNDATHEEVICSNDTFITVIL